MADQYITYLYVDGRPAENRQVEAQCSAAHAQISAGRAAPKTPNDLDAYRSWLEEEGLEEPEDLQGAWEYNSSPEAESETETESTDQVAGEVIGTIGDEEEDDQETEETDSGDASEEDQAEGTTEESEESEEEESGEETRERPPPTAAAQEMAEEAGLDLDSIQGSGKDGRVVVADVRALTEG